jgi:DNA repair exonuclease SbcCD nuclease subunit
MTFTFVHTADWQIGKPFASYPPELRGVLKDARLQAIDRLADVAAKAGARDILVAGDVFDASDLPERVLRPAIDRLGRAIGVTWHLLPGNHDPAVPMGAWERLVRIGLPANVRIYDAARPSELKGGVWLLPAPLKSKHQSLDPTQWMDMAGTPEGVIRVGLAHGSVRDFGQDMGEQGSSCARITPNRASSAGLAYLALGDWHGATKINERTWYSGTPEPERFRENEPGGALIVRIESELAPPQVERVRTGRFRWQTMTEQLAAAKDLDCIERNILALAPEPESILLRLTLRGNVPPAAHAQVVSWCARLEARLRYLEIDLDGLAFVTEADGLFGLPAGGEVRAAAEWLDRIAANASDPRREVAMAALSLLLRFVYEQRESRA